MQAINCVKGEIHNVLTALRLNSSARRSSYYLSHDESMEEPLIRELKSLHETLSRSVLLSHVDTRTVLDPFLRVIESPYIAATVTLTALQSVHKFLVYQHIHAESPEVQLAIVEIVWCMTRCRFDTNRWEDAEAVYMKSMEVCMECLRSSAGYLLTDAAVCAMVKECFRIRSRSGSSKLLRTYSENMASQMVLIVFARISPETNTTNGERILGPSVCVSPMRRPLEPLDLSSNGGTNGTNSVSSGGLLRSSTPRVVPVVLQSDNNDDDDTVRPYGEQALLRVFWFITNMINPQRDLDDRILGLQLLRIVLETAGESIGDFPSLVQVVQDEVCKHLLQNTQEKDLKTLSLCLRVVFDLFNTMKQHLKLQLEVFFISIHMRIGESESAVFEQKQLVLESLVEFCKEPSLIVGLYRNYDCEVGSTNLFEDLCGFLASGSIPTSEDSTPLNVLSLEAILAVVDSIGKRFCDYDSMSRPRTPFGTPIRSPSAPPDEEAKAIMSSRQKKKTLQVAAERFNREGKDSFKFLHTIKVLVGEPPSTEWLNSMVDFLRETPHLDKTRIGELLGSHKPLSKQILQAYVDSFDFESSVAFDEALRMFLESFRLPGESQQIERIMEAYAKRFYDCAGEQSPLKSADAAFVLAYSVIMLNTDAFNPQVKHKMTCEAFCRNNRGINDGEDLSTSYLTSIYESVVTNEIRMRDSKDNDANWSSVVRRSATTGPFQTEAPNIHGKEMFSLVWEKALHIFHHYLQQQQRHHHHPQSNDGSHDDDKVLHKLCEGFHTLSRICGFYSLNDILNKMVIMLCNTVNSFFHEQLGDGLESDDHIQRITILLFNIVVGYGGEHVVEAWPNVLESLLWMSRLELLTSEFTELDDFTDASGRPLPTLRESRDVNANSVDSGESLLFTWFGSATATAANSSNTTEVNGKGVQHTVNSGWRECVENCQIHELFQSVKFFHSQPLQHLLQALVLVSSQPCAGTSVEFYPKVLMDDESAVWCLERICEIVERCQENDTVWMLAQRHFESVFQRAPTIPTFYIERAVVNVLRFSVRLQPVAKMTPRLLAMLALFKSLSVETLNAMNERVAAGLQIFVQTHGDNVVDEVQWRLVFGLLGPSQTGFETLAYIVENSVIHENFRLCLDRAMAFAVGDEKRMKHSLDLVYKLYTWLGEQSQSGGSQGGGGGGGGGAGAGWSNEENRKHERRRGDLWLVVLESIAGMCREKREYQRRAALNLLQQALLTSGVEILSPRSWQQCFINVLLPLLQDSHDHGEVVAIVFQTFLHNLSMLAAIPDFHVFWLKFLGGVESVLTRGGIDSERVAEGLKNLILVMHVSKVFAEIDRRTGQDLRALTWVVVERMHGSGPSAENLKSAIEEACIGHNVTSPRAPAPSPAPSSAYNV